MQVRSSAFFGHVQNNRNQFRCGNLFVRAEIPFGIAIDAVVIQEGFDVISRPVGRKLSVAEVFVIIGEGGEISCRKDGGACRKSAAVSKNAKYYFIGLSPSCWILT